MNLVSHIPSYFPLESDKLSAFPLKKAKSSPNKTKKSGLQLTDEETFGLYLTENEQNYLSDLATSTVMVVTKKDDVTVHMMVEMLRDFDSFIRVVKERKNAFYCRFSDISDE